MSPYTVPPVEQFQEPLSSLPAENPAPWRTTYDLDWPMILFWGAYLFVLMLMTVCAGWSWLVWKVWG